MEKGNLFGKFRGFIKKRREKQGSLEGGSLQEREGERDRRLFASS